MSGLFAKALMPIATSIFRKSAPLGFGGIRSFFSKAPSLASVSSGLGNVSRVGSEILDSPLVDVLASQVGGQRGLALARQGLKGLDTAKNVTDEARNILEKVKSVQPLKKSVNVPTPPRMPQAFSDSRGIIGGYR